PWPSTSILQSASCASSSGGISVNAPIRPIMWIRPRPATFRAMVRRVPRHAVSPSRRDRIGVIEAELHAMRPTPILPPPVAPRKRRRRSWLLGLLGFGFASAVLLFVAAAGVVGFFVWKVSRDLPDYESLAKYEPPVMTRIHAHDGSLMAEYARERRIFVPINVLPRRVVAAFLSAEDKRFYEHGGLEFTGIGRAAYKFITRLSQRSDRRTEGASTITQQVAKNFLLTSDRTLERKLKEAILAIRIERAYSKEKILELYLNEIYLG